MSSSRRSKSDYQRGRPRPMAADPNVHEAFEQLVDIALKEA